MFCPKCGNEIIEGARFCPRCGYELPFTDSPSEDLYEDHRYEDAVRGNAPYEEDLYEDHRYACSRYGEDIRYEYNGYVEEDFRKTPRRKRGQESSGRRGSGRGGNGRGSSGNGRNGGSGGRDDGGNGSGKGMKILMVLLVVGIAVLVGLGVLLFLQKRGAGSGSDGQAQAGPGQTVSQAQTAAGQTQAGAEQAGGQSQAASGQTQAGTEQPAGQTQTAAGQAQDFAAMTQQVQSAGLQGGNQFTLVTSDVTEYPSVKLYYEYRTPNGDPIVLSSPTAGIMETIEGGAEIERTIRSIERLEGNVGLGIDILVDKSDSMEGDLSQVQWILQEFISSLDYASGDAAEIISFDSYIMYMCTYTNQIENLLTGISNMAPYGMTALYDALVTGIGNAGARPGANCVIAFTDGMDNESVHTYDEAIALALQKEIPVYIIGTGSADEGVLSYIAQQTGGYYWNINSISDMNEILQRIYTVQKNMYCIEYESDAQADAYLRRTVSCVLTDGTAGAVSMGTVFEPVRRQETVTHATRYEVIPGDVSWTEANDACIARGGHLATITSQQEMDQLTAMANGAGLKYLWIGGYTSVRDNTAFGHWLTGEPFGFTAWFPGEPSRNDKDGTPEFYLMLWNIDGAWSWNDQRNDVVHDTGLGYFTGNMGYICEYEQ